MIKVRSANSISLLVSHDAELSLDGAKKRRVFGLESYRARRSATIRGAALVQVSSRKAACLVIGDKTIVRCPAVEADWTIKLQDGGLETLDERNTNEPLLGLEYRDSFLGAMGQH